MRKSFPFVECAAIVLLVIGHSEGSLYSFDERADKLVRAFFPTTVVPEVVLEGYARRQESIDYLTLNEVLLASQKSDLASGVKPYPIQIPQDHLESYWLGIRRVNGLHESFLESFHAAEILQLVNDISQEDLVFSSILEKALFQRDVFQIYHILFQLAEAVAGGEGAQTIHEVSRALARLLEKNRLSTHEFLEVRETFPKEVDPGSFVACHELDTRRNYLPGCVFETPGPTWYALPVPQDATEHFRHYRGRSFIRIWFRTPGMSEQALLKYWKQTYGKYRGRHHVAGRLPSLPAGTETVLIRTFGVFLDNWDYIDSGYPEEVIIRILKYDRMKLDLLTSDYRGTLVYAYKMKRRRLRDNPTSLGLTRIAENDPTFTGFFSEVPDPYNSYRPSLQTMRYNCINCHSPVFYGPSTIFSLGLKPPEGFGSPEAQGTMLMETERKNRYRLITPEFKRLMQILQEGRN